MYGVLELLYGSAFEFVGEWLDTDTIGAGEI